jgi:hypothetical protein
MDCPAGSFLNELHGPGMLQGLPGVRIGLFRTIIKKSFFLKTLYRFKIVIKFASLSCLRYAEA